MRSRPRPLRTALRALAFGATLMLCLMMALQFFPRLRATFGLVQTGTAQQTNVLPAEPRRGDELPSESESDDFFPPPALSGSVAAGKSRGAGTASAENSSTIEMPESDSAAEMIPSPPIDPVLDETVAGGDDLYQLQHRLAQMERRTATDPRDRNNLEQLYERLQSQSTEWKTALARLESAERQLKSVQESVESLKSAGPSAHPSGDPSQRISIRSVVENDESRLVIQAHNASLPELLVRLGEASGVNILVSPSVVGPVSLYLSLPDGEAALDAICRNHHCRMERTGNFVLISRTQFVGENSAGDQQSQTITKLYRLKHLSGADVLPHVQGLLTPGVGTVNFPSFRDRLNRGVNRDSPRAILVKDSPAVIVKVDRLLQELDRPLAHGRPSSASLQPLSDESELVPPQPLPASSALPLPLRDVEAFVPPVHGTWVPRR